MNEFDPRENPLVERAFRIGFRRGPGSFRLGWYLAGLALATLGPFFPRLLDDRWGIDDACRWMLFALLGLLALIFVVGGFQRMLVSFTQERERGTFDFLHLSTLRPSAIVLGFLMAGQLPGYLALVIITPLLVIAALVSGFPLGILAALLASLVFAALALSIFFLFFGFWAKKTAEFRGAAVVYALVYCFGGWLVASGLERLQILPAGVPQSILGAPVIIELYGIGSAVSQSPDLAVGGGPGVSTAGFFGTVLPIWLLGIVLLAPPMAIVFLALSRSLRHRDRAPWSTVHATLLHAWSCLALVGVWWGTPIPGRMRIVALSLFAWFVARRLLERVTPTRVRTVHALGRVRGSLSELLRAPEGGPPLCLAGALFLTGSAACALIAGEAAIGGGAAAEGGRALLWAFAPALFAIPYAAFGAIDQWLAWRSPHLRWGMHILAAFVLIGPFLALMFGRALLAYPLVPESALRAFAALSPFSHLLGLARGAGSEGLGLGAVLAGQLLHAAALAVGIALLRRSGRDLERRGRELLDGLDAAPAADGAGNPPPAGAAPTP